MKFGKLLLHQQYVPWAQEYVPYKQLKKLLKGAAEQQTKLEADFLNRLVGAVQTVNAFYLAKESELVTLLKRLCMQASAKGESALHESAARVLLRPFQQVCFEVQRLKDFSRLNTLAVHKARTD